MVGALLYPKLELKLSRNRSFFPEFAGKQASTQDLLVGPSINSKYPRAAFTIWVGCGWSRTVAQPPSQLLVPCPRALVTAGLTDTVSTRPCRRCVCIFLLAYSSRKESSSIMADADTNPSFGTELKVRLLPGRSGDNR
jgi:hypothetical protein